MAKPAALLNSLRRFAPLKLTSVLASVLDSIPASFLLASTLVSIACAPRPFGPWTPLHSSDWRVVAPVLHFEACSTPATCALRMELRDEADTTWRLEIPPRPQPVAAQHFWLTDSGLAETATHCELREPSDPHCQPAEAPLRAKAEVLILDAQPREAQAQGLQERLVQSIIDNDPAPQRWHPRWLVLNRPVESAGATGLGTRRGNDTFLQLPEAIRTLLIGGYVDGVIASSEDGSEFISDIGEAIQRSSHQWIKTPVFQAVVGRNQLRPWQRWTRRSSAYQPQLWSRKPGIVLDIDGWADPSCDIELRFVAPSSTPAKDEPKNQATFVLPRVAPRHSLLRPRSHVEPCLGCKARRSTPPYAH